MDKSKNKPWLWILLILPFIIYSIYQWNVNSSLKSELELREQNQSALTDTVRTLKNSLGEEVQTKSVLIADKDQLKKLNRSLANDIDRLEGKVITIQTLTGKIDNVRDKPITIINKVTKYPDGTNELSWRYDTTFNEGNSRSIAGKSSFLIDSCGVIDKGTQITEDKITVKITTGLVKLDDLYQVQVTTSYPGMSFSHIDGAILDPELFKKEEESSIVFGPSISVGYGIGWDQLKNSPSAGPTLNLGFSATFNINKYAKKITKWFKRI